ncbi:MAG: hypothetical protein Q9217_006442 [Psora testacea]
MSGPNVSHRHHLKPLTKIHPDVGYSSTGPPTSTAANPSTYTAFSPRMSSQAPTSSLPSQPYNNPMFTSRRTPSQSTSSSTAFTPSRTPSNVSSKISRTSSTKSGASAASSSYVALMRKQKATVWCDRAQHEDPRIVAQQKAAKIRAAREITGAGRASEGRTSTSGSMGSSSLGVRSKIRHHGVPKASGYSSANMVGGGVPTRLSANEVGDDGTYLGNPSGGRTSHNRTSSAHSRDSRSQFLTVDTQQPRRYSQGSTPLSGQGTSNEDIPELEETPMPANEPNADYFSSEPGQGGSGGSSEREASFGNVAQMEAPKAKNEGKSQDELRRRGSVDERANTMSFMGGGRLFVANPD